MNIGTVRRKIVTAFSAVILLIVALCAFAYVQLRGIEAQAVVLSAESLPGLYLSGQLQTTSVVTYTSVQQLILEADLERRRQIMAYLESKTAERLDLLKKYLTIVKTEKQRELLAATQAALTPYMAVRREVERLSDDPKTRVEAAAVLRGQLEPLYVRLQEAV